MVITSADDGSRLIQSRSTKIGVIGVGYVGATTAYALLLSGLAAEIVLVDINADKAEGEAMDLSHAAPFSRQTTVTAGGYEDLVGASIIVVTAGANQLPHQSRMDLLRVNYNVFSDVIPRVVAAAPDCILIIATNPVDVLTHVSVKLSGFAPNRVIGSGTLLDTARFKHELGRHFSIDPNSVHALIVGEHGDSEVALWSLATIAGMRLPDYCTHADVPYNAEALDACFQRTRRAAYDIIRRKGMTDFGISSGIVRLVRAVLRDEKTLLTVSTVGVYAGVSDIALSVPTKVGRSGAYPVPRLLLSPEEEDALRKSAQRIREGIDSLPPR